MLVAQHQEVITLPSRDLKWASSPKTFKGQAFGTDHTGFQTQEEAYI